MALNVLTPVSWKPPIRPVDLPKDMPTAVVSTVKAAKALGVTPAQLLAATVVDWRGLTPKTINKTPNTYSCDQVIELMKRRRRPGVAAFERALLAKLRSNLDTGRRNYRYPDAYICEDFLPPIPRLALA